MAEGRIGLAEGRIGLEEEILSLKSIYCGKGECLVSLISAECGSSILTEDDILNNTSNCLSHKDIIQVVVTLRHIADDVPHIPCASLRVEMTLHPSYPVSEPPEISLSSMLLTREYTHTLEQEVTSYFKTVQSAHNHCLFDILERIKDSLMKLRPCDFKDWGVPPIFNQENKDLVPVHSPRSGSQGNRPPKEGNPKEKEPGNHVLIARLDHIRNKDKYLKLLQTWARELGVHGKILNVGKHHIYPVLLGPERTIAEFLRRWRTEKVDVDSRGRPCKERMIEVLYQERVAMAAPHTKEMRYQMLAMWLSLSLGMHFWLIALYALGFP